MSKTCEGQSPRSSGCNGKTDQRIPYSGKQHKNTGDETLCSGRHCCGGLMFATSSSLRTEILEKSCRMRQCTQTREKNIRATMSANEQHFRAPTRTCAPYPRTNSVSRQTVLSDSGTSLARLSMVSLSSFALFWITNVCQGKTMIRPAVPSRTK